MQKVLIPLQTRWMQ